MGSITGQMEFCNFITSNIQTKMFPSKAKKDEKEINQDVIQSLQEEKKKVNYFLMFLLSRHMINGLPIIITLTRP